eukprot:2833979-Rhodomonas_salina.2
MLLPQVLLPTMQSDVLTSGSDGELRSSFSSAMLGLEIECSSRDRPPAPHPSNCSSRPVSESRRPMSEWDVVTV